jgi:hypothetical protein
LCAGELQHKSLDAVCPKCGGLIPPAEVRRIDFDRIECPVCGERFVREHSAANYTPSSPDESHYRALKNKAGLLAKVPVYFSSVLAVRCVEHAWAGSGCSAPNIQRFIGVATLCSFSLISSEDKVGLSTRGRVEAPTFLCGVVGTGAIRSRTTIWREVCGPLP